MRKFLTALVLVPLAIVFVAFAVANRHLVTVSFDPFNSADPASSITLPLFAVIILIAILGVIAGSMATWFRQGHWRRAARRLEVDAERARADLADLRVQVALAARNAVQPASAGGPAATGSGLLSDRLHGAGERDKTGSTL